MFASVASRSRRAKPVGSFPLWLAWVIALLVALAPGWALAAPSTVGAAEAHPGDAPHLSGQLPKVPAAPGSYHQHDGGWIKFVYPAGMRQRIEPLIHQADGVRAQMTARFGYPVLQHVEVRVARTHREMATLAPEGVPFPGYASGVAYGQLGLVLLSIDPRFPSAHHDLGEIFRHELAHVALYDATGGRRVPKWFNEGLAVHLSNESSLTRVQTLWTATLSNRLMPLRKLDRSFPADPVRTDVAYAQAADVVRFLMRQQDRDRFSALAKRIRNGQTFEAAVADAYSIDLDTLEAQWREDVAKRYTFWPVFFSSGVVWVGALGLFAWGWRRRKRRDRATLERWAREEAAEDARRAAAAQAEAAEAEAPLARLHVVLTRPPPVAPRSTSGPEEVPKVEHEGSWHTLH